jgi:ribokinase
MYDLVSIGNITIDLFYRSSSFTQSENRFNLAIGGKYVAEEFYECLGGGGANVAVNVASHGLSTAVLGKVGLNVFKQFIIQKLLKKSVSIEYLQYDDDFINISSILLTQSGERTIINYPTANEKITLSDNMKRNIVNTRMVYLGNLPDISVNQRVDLLNLFVEKNVPVAINLGVKDCRTDLKVIKSLLDLTNIFILNTHEYADLIKKPIEKINFKENCADEIKFSKKILIITDGEKGSYGYEKGNIYYQETITPSKIIDTTGAGDAYTAGFLAGMIQEKSIKESMLQGAEYASVIMGKVGAQ